MSHKMSSFNSGWPIISVFFTICPTLLSLFSFKTLPILCLSSWPISPECYLEIFFRFLLIFCYLSQLSPSSSHHGPFHPVTVVAAFKSPFPFSPTAYLSLQFLFIIRVEQLFFLFWAEDASENVYSHFWLEIASLFKEYFDISSCFSWN